MFKNIHEIMEELKKTGREFNLVSSNGPKDELDGIIRMNYGLKSINRRLTVWDDLGGIFAVYQGYIPLNGGSVVYKEI